AACGPARRREPRKTPDAAHPMYNGVTGSRPPPARLSHVPVWGCPPMALSAAQVAEQKKQVEELLADETRLGFAKSLFFGRFRGDLLFPYPVLPPDKQA